LVEDLLDVTRVTRGKIELQPEVLDLNQVAQRTVLDHRGAFVEAEVELEMRAASAEVWVNGDRTRLSQVIGNLLHNAVKFTPRGGKTTVSVEADLARKRAIVCVQDTGRGIEPELLPRLFEAFSQADASLDRTMGGLGLGLSVVKGLIEMHGGTVRGESEGPGHGATFTIELPLEGNGPATRQPPRGETQEQNRRILVIDDNPDSVISLRMLLKARGHEVEVAYSGPEGLTKARADHPDVVICDIGLPGMDGYELARQMRADPELSHIALVAFSGYAGPKDIAKAKEAGFDAHMAKPLTLETLQSALRVLSIRMPAP
jgi:two-component system CheB/CheR fusion protein